MRKAVPKDSLDKMLTDRCKDIVSFLKSKNINVAWYFDDSIKGYARNDLSGTICFRSKKDFNQYNILHELLHLELLAKGYQRIDSRDVVDYDDSINFTIINYAISMLSDIFEHIMISPELEKEEHSIYEKELPAEKKFVTQFLEKFEAEQSFTILGRVLYARCKTMRTSNGLMEQLEQKVDQSVTKKLFIHLPQPSMSPKIYSEKLKEWVQELGLLPYVEFKQINIRK